MIIDLVLGILFSLSIALLLLVLFMYLWARYKKLFIQPSNTRDWCKNQLILAKIEFIDDVNLVINNVRNTLYKSYKKYVPKYSKIKINTNDILSGKLHIVKLTPVSVHVFISFISKYAEPLTFSVKMRRLKDTRGLSRFFKLFYNPSELVYLLMTEKDALLGSKALGRKIKSFDLNLDKKTLAKLFTDMSKRTNHLHKNPEYYNLFSNNCITNVIDHINKVADMNISKQVRSYTSAKHLSTLLKKYKLVK